MTVREGVTDLQSVTSLIILATSSAIIISHVCISYTFSTHEKSLMIIFKDFSCTLDIRKYSMTTIMWQNKDQTDYSIEYFNLTSECGINTMKGTVILLLDRVPTLVNYEIVSDKYWKTRSIKISQQMSDNENVNIDIRVSRDQNWREHDTDTSSHHSTIIDFASGLYDVDLQVAPATNSLPINRLGLKGGESQEIDVVWIGFPGLTLDRQEQKYSRINNKYYKFEIPSTGFRAQLEVDNSGFVINYDTLWHRLN
jgi:hypothetical protein